MGIWRVVVFGVDAVRLVAWYGCRRACGEVACGGFSPRCAGLNHLTWLRNISPSCRKSEGRTPTRDTADGQVTLAEGTFTYLKPLRRWLKSLSA